MTIFVLPAMDINPTLCDSMLPSRMKVQKWRDAILGSIRLVKRVYVSILGRIPSKSSDALGVWCAVWGPREASSWR